MDPQSSQGAVVVTGHSGGIGSAIASLLETHGYLVVGIDSAVPDAGPLDVVFDLREVEHGDSLRHLEEALETAIGSHPLMGLVNNAATQRLGAIDDLALASFSESFTTNALAPMALIRMLAGRLSATGGTVLNIGSVHATQTKRGFAPYSVSKAALSGVTRACAIEYGRQFRTVELRPAAIATSMLEAGFEAMPEKRALLDSYHPTAEIGRPEEVAQVCLAVLELPGRFLNGSVINFDGGISFALHDPD